jgi:hypothetical protein
MGVQRAKSHDKLHSVTASEPGKLIIVACRDIMGYPADASRRGAGLGGANMRGASR